MTPGVKHTIRRTLLALGAGMVLQRVCQLIAFVLIGRALGVAGLGIYAQGQALAAVLGSLAGAGIRNLTARSLAAQPGAARGLLLAAVRARLQLGALLLGPVLAIAAAYSELPWFWVWCALQVVPNAFDLKNLIDATGRTGREVGLESAIALLQLLAVLAWTWLWPERLDVLAAIALGCRCLYAVGSIAAIRALPGDSRIGQAPPRQWILSGAQTAHELLTIGDVWLVAIALGDAAAGYYAIGVRFAAAALLPSAQLARLLLPHLMRAGIEGDPHTTLATALRSTLLATLPMLAGGAAAAVPLCALGGPAFVDAAPALRLLLLAGCLQHLGWQCANAMLAVHRDRAFTVLLALPAALQVALVAMLRPLSLDGATAATAAAAAAAVAHAAFASTGLSVTRPFWLHRRQLLRHPTCIAASTGAAAATPLLDGLGPTTLALQLLAGSAVFVAGLWWLELRGRWRRLGDGLAAASGFVS